MTRKYRNRECISNAEFRQLLEANILQPRPTPLLVYGEKGSAKTSIARQFAQDHADTHTLRMVDGAAVNAGDGRTPVASEDGTAVSIVPTDLLISPQDAAANRPQIIVLDEVGKMPRPVQNELLTVLDPTPHIANYVFPEHTLVVMLTNWVDEGLGDVVPEHMIDRCEVQHKDKVSVEEAQAYGQMNNWHPAVIASFGLGRGPEMFQCAYTDGEIAKRNSMIPNPAFAGKVESVVTMRGLENCSKILQTADQTGMTAGLVRKRLQGQIGAEAAAELDAAYSYYLELPTWTTLTTQPDTCTLPDGEGGRAVLVFSALVRMASSEEYAKHFDAVVRAVKRLGASWTDVLFKHTLAHKQATDSPLWAASQRSNYMGEWTINNMDLL